jgi:hypothetical protein
LSGLAEFAQSTNTIDISDLFWPTAFARKSCGRRTIERMAMNSELLEPAGNTNGIGKYSQVGMNDLLGLEHSVSELLMSWFSCMKSSD